MTLVVFHKTEIHLKSSVAFQLLTKDLCVTVDWEMATYGYKTVSISPDHNHLVVSLTTNHLLLVDLPEYFQVGYLYVLTANRSSLHPYTVA
jgi:hypothetical protein